MKATRDVIFGGRVVLHQPGRGEGYRVNADALLLADFAGRARGTVFDLGAGVGAVALVMLARALAQAGVLVDDDEDACALARRNIEANGSRATVIAGDVLEVARAHPGRASLVVCNPPYFPPGTTRSRGRARVGDVERFVHAARTVLGHRGRACFVYPASALAPLMATCRARGLEPKRLRFVHATGGVAARVALLEVRASKSGGLVVLPPLVERSGPRHADYTDETARALGLNAEDNRK